VIETLDDVVAVLVLWKGEDGEVDLGKVIAGPHKEGLTAAVGVHLNMAELITDMGLLEMTDHESLARDMVSLEGSLRQGGRGV